MKILKTTKPQRWERHWHPFLKIKLYFNSWAIYRLFTFLKGLHVMVVNKSPYYFLNISKYYETESIKWKQKKRVRKKERNNNNLKLKKQSILMYIYQPQILKPWNFLHEIKSIWQEKSYPGELNGWHIFLWKMRAKYCPI